MNIDTAIIEQGMFHIKSKLGTFITCYSYYDFDFKPDKYIFQNKGWIQKIINIEFKILHRKDKIYFNLWEDFTLYSTNDFHQFLTKLQKYGFEISKIY